MIAANIAAVALLALVPPPIDIYFHPSERTPITVRDTRPITRCAFKGCIHVGRWPQGDCCPMHEGATGARIATPELIAEIDARYGE
jgi:hypothetical protein